MIYLDTNILIYVLEGGYPFTLSAARELEHAQARNQQFITSTLTITEFMAGRTESPPTHPLQTVPSLTLWPVDEAIAMRAAGLQRVHSLEIGDAVHLATSLERHCELFFTNDNVLAKVAARHGKVLKPTAA